MVKQHIFFTFSFFVLNIHFVFFSAGLLPAEGKPRRLDPEAEERTLRWNLQDLQVSQELIAQELQNEHLGSYLCYVKDLKCLVCY